MASNIPYLTIFKAINTQNLDVSNTIFNPDNYTLSVPHIVTLDYVCPAPVMKGISNIVYNTYTALPQCYCKEGFYGYNITACKACPGENKCKMNMIQLPHNLYPLISGNNLSYVPCIGKCLDSLVYEDENEQFIYGSNLCSEHYTGYGCSQCIYEKEIKTHGKRDIDGTECIVCSNADWIVFLSAVVLVLIGGLNGVNTEP